MRILAAWRRSTRSPRIGHTLHVVAAGILLALTALAPVALPTPSLAAALEPTGSTVEIDLNEGRLIRLSRQAASVFIANPEIADVSVQSSRLVYLFGTQTGETTLFAVDENDEVIASHRVRVLHNVSRLNEALGQLVPGGGVQAVSLDGGIILSGEVSDAQTAENARRIATRFVAEEEQIINQLGISSSDQVHLRVKIAEISRDIINEFGINWETAFDSGDIVFGLATGTPVDLTTLFGTNTVSPALGFGNFLTRPATSGSSLFGGFQLGDVSHESLLNILEEDGLVSILAEPNLTAASGETASFLAGGEFPIPVAQSDDTVSIEFKPFGVSLAFTPFVLSGRRIAIKVRPEVSQITTSGAITLQGFFIPALTVRRAETTVELASGQSFAIAGLILNNSTQTFEQVPGFSDLPIIGPLFDSDRFERNETELVIMVTPYLVNPVSNPDQIELPTEPFYAASADGGAEMARSPAKPQTLPLANAGGRAGVPAGVLSGFIVE